MHWNRRLTALVLVLLVTNAPSTDEKRISIYSTAANYSLPLIERNGGDYVGLLEILDPLGSVSARNDGPHWKIRYNNIEGEFTSGKSRMRIRGKDSDLPANFLLERGRGLVPVSSLSTLLPRFLGGPVTFHENARRLFVGSVATHFSSELSKTNPPPMPPPAVSTPPVIAPPNANTNHQAPYLVVLDASHGGDERGAALTDKLAEKDVTLAITRRLKQELENRGVSVLMLRDADATLSLDQRAALANNSRPAIFVTLHASSQGNGVRLYTALIPAG